MRNSPNPTDAGLLPAWLNAANIAKLDSETQALFERLRGNILRALG